MLRINGAATQIASAEFDRDFFQLPAGIQAIVQRKLDDMGLAYRHFHITE